MIPDKYQQAVIDECAKVAGPNLLVMARAGAGKTATILNAIAAIPTGKTIAVFAFNKKIQQEMLHRLSLRRLQANVMTLNSYGMRQCNGARIDDGKLHRLTKAVFDDLSQKDSVLAKADSGDASKYHRAVRRGVGLAKCTLMTSAADIADLVNAYNIELPGEKKKRDYSFFKEDFSSIADDAPTHDYDYWQSRFGEDVLRVMRACFRDHKTVDFDDQIWMPVVRKSSVEQFDVVFIDETQDLNLAQIRLAQMARKLGGRIVAVGDDRQAIYAFRGADSRAMDRVKTELSAIVLPLSVSYRCSRAVVEYARQWVPSIEPAKGAPLGSVDECDIEQMLENAQNGDFIVSRKNAPLMKACNKLLLAGKSAAVLGRDIGGEFARMVELSRARTIRDLLAWVKRWEMRQIESMQSKNPDADTAPIVDKAECVRVLAEANDSIAGLSAHIQQIFADTESANRITLMSTHKAKGLEAERVWMLIGTYLQRPGIEEENLAYVAATRAKKTLYLVSETKQ